MPNLPGQFHFAGASVNRLGYGAMQLAGPGVWGPPKDHDGAIALLREVVALGVNHIDTSDSYGPYTVNQLICRAIHPYPEDLIIVTKVGARRTPDRAWVPALSPEEITSAIHDNLSNLGLESLDVVNLRVGTAMSCQRQASVAGPFGTLADLRQRGLIRHLGLSNITAGQLQEAQLIAPVVCVQNHYNFVHRGDDTLIDTCAAQGIAFVPYLPLGGFSPIQSAVLESWAGRLGVTPMQIALAWLLQRSPNILLIPGTSSIEHLRENVAAASLDLPREAVADLDRIGGYAAPKIEVPEVPDASSPKPFAIPRPPAREAEEFQTPPMRTLDIEHKRDTTSRLPDDVRALIRNKPFFMCLTNEQVGRIVGAANVSLFGRGERIVEQGAEGSSMYIILTGAADVYIRQQDQESEPTRVASLQAGDYFGEMSLLTGEARSATVIATSDCEILEIAKTHLAQILQENTALLTSLSEMLGKRRLDNEGILAWTAERQVLVGKKDELTRGFVQTIGRFFDLCPGTTEAGDEAFLASDNVQFTVYRPKTLVPGTLQPLLAFAHLAEARADGIRNPIDPVREVEKQARAILGQSKEAYQKLVQDSTQPIPREGELCFVPEAESIEFDPPTRSFVWRESVHREVFLVSTSDALSGRTIRGRLSIFLGNLLIGEVPLTFHVIAGGASAEPAEAMETEVSRRYRKIFASYSHKDTQVVGEFQKYATMLGDDYLRDVNTLRAGEDWNERLKELIRAADVFQLFWSWNSIDSPFVRHEYEYAARLGRANFIRPVYWEDPLPARPDKHLPPDELRCLHFHRLVMHSPAAEASDSKAGPPAFFAEPYLDAFDALGPDKASELARACAPLEYYPQRHRSKTTPGLGHGMVWAALLILGTAGVTIEFRSRHLSNGLQPSAGPGTAAITSSPVPRTEPDTQISIPTNPIAVADNRGEKSDTAVAIESPGLAFYPQHRLIFHPPVLADLSLGERIGGGARGAGGTDASLLALVPEQVALTTKEQPSLFWFQSKRADARLELTLIEPGNPKPMLALGSSSGKPGVHRIRLGNHGVTLQPEVDYKWTVSLVPNPANRSMDIAATGMVKRVQPSKKLAQELAAASVADRPAIYARAGIWYDALEAISDEIDANPNDQSLRQQRAELLKQVGLAPVGKE